LSVVFQISGFFSSPKAFSPPEKKRPRTIPTSGLVLGSSVMVQDGIHHRPACFVHQNQILIWEAQITRQRTAWIMIRQRPERGDPILGMLLPLVGSHIHRPTGDDFSLLVNHKPLTEVEPKSNERNITPLRPHTFLGDDGDDDDASVWTSCTLEGISGWSARWRSPRGSPRRRTPPHVGDPFFR
jgi:hypothetical protein